MLGFGYASEKYMTFLQKTVVSTVLDACVAADNQGNAVVRHVRTPPLSLSTNRRERVVATESEEAAAKRQKKGEVMWFERGGATRLGQRLDGPKVPYADAIQFYSKDDPSKVYATLFSFACHPVCCGKGLQQSADYVHAARLAVETATNAPSIFLTGAAGDVNPLDRRGAGYEAADAMGEALGTAIAHALAAPAPKQEFPPVSPNGVRMPKQESAGAMLCTSIEAVKVPLAPLPTEAEATTFLKEQQDWLEKTRATGAALGPPPPATPPPPPPQQTSSGGGKKGGSKLSKVSTTALDPSDLPRATIGYAEDLLAAVKAKGGAAEAPLNVMTIALGTELAIVGIEAEPFSEFALHLSKASPFKTTITVGYANGCLAYLPTHAETFYGGYEVMHAHVVYGQMQKLAPTAERPVVNSALKQLDACYRDVVWGSMNHLGYPQGKTNIPYTPHLLAECFDSGFPQAHDTYNSIGVCPLNKSVVYVLSSTEAEIGARIFSMDLGKQLEQSSPQDLGDVTASCQDPAKTVVQGKAHCPVVEDPENGDVYFGTHCGYYTEVDGMETLPVPPGRPSHLGPYPGGVVMKLAKGGRLTPQGKVGGKLTALCRIPDGEGIVTMTCDLKRKRIYCLSWPSGFLYLASAASLPQDWGAAKVDVRSSSSSSSPTGKATWSISKKIDYPGRGEGESVHPRTGRYRPVCRSMVVNPHTGKMYFTNNQGTVLEYDPDSNKVKELLTGAEGLSRDYFGKYDPNQPGSMGSHWRQVQWVDDTDGKGGRVIGMHGNSGYLFEMTLHEGGNAELSLIERLTSKPSQKVGMSDQFTYGYLGFAVSKKRIAYYLTGGPIFTYDGKRVKGKDSLNKGGARGLEHLHLVTYDLNINKYTDHGPIFYKNRLGFPTLVNSLTLSDDGWCYALGRLPDGTTDLFRVPDPHREGGGWYDRVPEGYDAAALRAANDYYANM